MRARTRCRALEQHPVAYTGCETESLTAPATTAQSSAATMGYRGVITQDNHVAVAPVVKV